MKVSAIRLFGEWPTCSQVHCEVPAKYSYVWDKEMFACEEHARQALGIANAVDFPAPQQTTTRLVRPEEFDPEKSSDEYE